MSDVVCEVKSGIGLITLNRPKALNALSLSMVRDLTAGLLDWRDNPHILAVAIRGSHKEGVFGHFCAGATSVFFTKQHGPATPVWKTFSPRNTPSTT